MFLVATACGDDARLVADGGVAADDASPDIDAGPKGDRWLQESGKILALREQTGLYLDEQRAAEIDSLVARAKRVDIDAEGVIFENIFARSSAEMDRVYLQSTDSMMEANWERGELASGDEDLDALLTSLEPTKIEPATSYLVQLWFARWVDIEELETYLTDHFSFLYASQVCHCIDGDDIELMEEENQARLVFHLKWEDCYSGCLNDHWWEIIVPHDPGLPAELVDEGGNPLPPP